MLHIRPLAARAIPKASGIPGVASIFSNGIWFASQFYIVNMLIAVKDDHWKFATVLVFYVVLTALGSVAAQWYLMKFELRKGIERG